MRLLLVEDDAMLGRAVLTSLKMDGYDVDWMSAGKSALHCLETDDYDLVILDLGLPDVDGKSVLATLRKRGGSTPVIILTARDSIADRVGGLDAGADDYMVKPFAFTELLARVEALLRRSPKSLDVSKLQFEDLVLDLKTKEVTRSNKRIELHAKEFSLLEYFLRNPGQVLSKTQILEKVWSYDFDPQTNVVDVLVCRLRNKIDKDFDDKTIHTIRGMGYVLKKD